MFDVIVAGGGPGGSMVAKKSVEQGFNALLLEKKKLPREKVCSGLVMRPWAYDTIREEYGEIPKEVLVAPYYLAGHMVHVPGVEPQPMEVLTPLAWRSDLDYWMNQKAVEKGVEVWDEAKVTGVSESDGGYKVQLVRRGERQELQAKFVIGADGADSVVRRSIFPGISFRMHRSYRECYRGALAIEKSYFHWFHPRQTLRPRFQIDHKGEFFVLGATEKDEIRDDIVRMLADYGFDPEQKPAWKDGCLISAFYEELVSGSFVPAKGNVMLIGDAAGFCTSISDGMGAAMRSGISAALSIAKATKMGRPAGEIYVEELKPLIAWLKEICALMAMTKDRTAKGPQAAMDALMEAWVKSQIG